jgi:anti-sigma factor RsiW
MTCREIEDCIEAVASGDEPTVEFRAHLEGCVACAAALARARGIERALALRPAPAAPTNFTAAVGARIRRERWRAEQHLDRLFNVAVLVAIVAVVAGVAALLNLRDLTAAIGAGLVALNRLGSVAAAQAAPTVSTYFISATLLATTMGVWWWAERRWSV